MTRDLVVKPLDYSPYISIHWEDATGGHDFQIDPPLDSPAYVAKFSQKENQFACGSDFRIDRTQVFGSAGVYVPTKGFRLFFNGEQFLLMGGFIGQPPIMFSAGGRSYEVVKNFAPEDGSYFTCGSEVEIGENKFLALCNSNTPNVIDLYSKPYGEPFKKEKSIDVGSTVIKIMSSPTGIYATFKDSYLFVDLTEQAPKVGEPIKAILHSVHHGVVVKDVTTLITSHDGNLYYANGFTKDPNTNVIKPNEQLITALQPKFDFTIQTTTGISSHNDTDILVCVYYYSSVILCEPVYYIVDKNGVISIPQSNITWNTSDKKNVGFTIHRDDRASGPYGLYKRGTYDYCQMGTGGAYSEYDGTAVSDVSGRDISSRRIIPHTNYFYRLTSRVHSLNVSYVYAFWRTYEHTGISPKEKGMLKTPDHPEGVRADSSSDYFEITNCSLFVFGKQKTNLYYLFDLNTHSYVGLFDATVPNSAIAARPDLTNIISGFVYRRYTYMDDIDALASYQICENNAHDITIRIDFFEKNTSGTYAYTATQFIDTGLKNISTTLNLYQTYCSVQYVKNYGLVIVVYASNPKFQAAIFKVTKTEYKSLTANNSLTANEKSTDFTRFVYLPKSECFVSIGGGYFYVWTLENDVLTFKYKTAVIIPVGNDGGFHGDFISVLSRYFDTVTVWKITKDSCRTFHYPTGINAYHWTNGETYGTLGCDSSERATHGFVGSSRADSSYYKTWRDGVVWPTAEVTYPCFSQYLPFDAKEGETLDDVSIDDTVNFTNQAEQTGRHLMYKDNSLYEIKRFPAEEYYSADHVFNVSYSPSGKFVIYQNPDGMNLARRKAGGNYVNISKKSLTFVDGYNAGWDSITEKDFETHPLHTKLSNFVFGKSPLLFTYLALPATDTLEAGVPDISNGTSSDEPLSPYGRRIVRTDGKNFYRIYYDWNKNMVRSHAAFDSGEIYMASTYLRSGGAESDIVLYLIAGDKATPPDAHGYSDLNNAFTCDRKPVKFGPIDFSVCDVVVVAHGRDNDQEQPFTFFKLDRKEHTLTDMHLKIDNWDVDAPILDVKFLDCDRIVVVTPDEAILIDDDEDDDEKKKKIKDRVKLKKGGIIKEVDKGKFKVDGDGDGSGMGSGGSGFGAGKDWLKPEYIVEALSINIFYRD